MAHSRRHHHHDGHEHTHDEHHDHSHGTEKTSAHGHTHGEPTGDTIEKISFTRSQFLRMCLAGVAAGTAAVSAPAAAAQKPAASRPRTDSYDDPLVFNGPSAYRQFLKKEGIPVYEGGAIDVNKVELKPWKRVGALGAYIFLEGTAGTVDAWVCEIPPGGQTTAGHHLFEEQILVLAGKGRTQFWQRDPKQMLTLEWERGAVFPIPLNARHRHINTGKDPVRMVAITNAPLLIDMFRHTDFIFDNDYVFPERFDGRKDYFSSKPAHVYPTVERDRSGKGGYKGHHTHSIVNFVPNIWKAQLYPAGQGVEDYDNHLAMSRNTMALHVEQFPTGTYERCHRHGPGSTIILLDGSGFSMMWPNETGTTPFKDGRDRQVQSTDWKEGTLLVPPLQWYHQHFNSGKVPARFVKLGGWNNDLYPFTTTLVSDPGRTEIDYPDEDPRVREIFKERLAASGGEFKMPENVFKR
ncbi:MAG TPA: cupin domain-containing protein [Burkholderiales bacterium]|nr:cupin domain-containing protein [Burkholderiales bacterium]